MTLTGYRIYHQAHLSTDHHLLSSTGDRLSSMKSHRIGSRCLFFHSRAFTAEPARPNVEPPIRHHHHHHHHYHRRHHHHHHHHYNYYYYFISSSSSSSSSLLLSLSSSSPASTTEAKLLVILSLTIFICRLVLLIKETLSQLNSVYVCVCVCVCLGWRDRKRTNAFSTFVMSASKHNTYYHKPT